ncbi:TPR repeat [Variovorax sp. WDL1]|nr:TPR repeat [Variovorax sp. WDL1]
MLLRTAHELHQAKIPPRKILASLRRLKAALPAEIPLTGMRITAVGAEVAVRERGASWEAASGQLLMDFEVEPVDGGVTILEMRRPASTQRGETEASASEWFRRGEDLEDTDPRQAAKAYQEALELKPDYVEAYVNLGALMCEAKHCSEAVALYSKAMTVCAPSALLHFNMAIALEDLGRLEEAVEHYERCLELDPSQADAHFNLGCLGDKLGDGKSALRHFNAYRRMTRP